MIAPGTTVRLKAIVGHPIKIVSVLPEGVIGHFDYGADHHGYYHSLLFVPNAEITEPPAPKAVAGRSYVCVARYDNNAAGDRAIGTEHGTLYNRRTGVFIAFHPAMWREAI